MENKISENHYETLVDKTIIHNLEREIEFMKNEIIVKNEILQNLIRYNTQIDNINENAWNIKDTSDTCSCRHMFLPNMLLQKLFSLYRWIKPLQ